MKKINFVFILLAMLSSCSTDFDTAAPWKETMVVYGFLNPNDAVQYIRVSKAFLGEGNALTMAQQPDSIYYRDSLEVTMMRTLNNSVFDSFPLVLCDSNEVPKEAGTFFAPYQAVYKYEHSLHPSATNDGSIYKLTITNKNTGNVVKASTKLIENFSITAPNTSSLYRFNSQLGQSWRFTTSPLGKIYGITQKINYVEKTISTNDTVTKSIDWYLGDKTAVSSDPADMRFAFPGTDLYRLLGDNIAVDADKTRHLAANPIDVYITAGTEELYTYIQVSNQNTGITQDKPLYTNIENGVGLFTSRNTRKISILLNGDTYAALDTSAYTRNLNFTH